MEVNGTHRVAPSCNGCHELASGTLHWIVSQVGVLLAWEDFRTMLLLARSNHTQQMLDSGYCDTWRFRATYRAVLSVRARKTCCAASCFSIGNQGAISAGQLSLSPHSCVLCQVVLCNAGMVASCCCESQTMMSAGRTCDTNLPNSSARGSTSCAMMGWPDFVF